MMRALVVVNSRSSGLRRMRSWLEEDGVEAAELIGGEDELPSTLAGYDALVLLGGGFMPDDDVNAPWLRVERALATLAVKLDFPTLGICLGAQLLAHVAGGDVRARTGPVERGSTVIALTGRGAEDAVLTALGSSSPMIENHEDLIVALPRDAVHLARSEAVENQAFRLGRHVRGVQFHPEACADDLATWDEAALEGEGRRLGDLIDRARRDHVANTAASRALVRAFADDLKHRATAMRLARNQDRV